MIPAGAAQIPADGDELAGRVARSLRDALHLGTGVAVTAAMSAPGAVDHLSIDLSGSVIDNRYLSRSAISLRPPRSTAGGVATELGSLTLTGRPVVAFGAPIFGQLDAQHVPATWLHDDSGQLWLAFRDERAAGGPTAGRAVVEGEVAAVSTAAGTVAAELAQQMGVAVRDVRVTPLATGPNRWRFDLAARVSKGFASTNVTGHAQVSLDDNLVVRVEELTARAGGLLGSLAQGMIESHLGRYRDRAFNLKELTFAGARVTGLDVELAERFRVTVTLGS
ncbi:hypothetical protein [Georgenia daeguensis]|uniref:DUF2993 domain-containing protein n=1 Tax=Georgenia daeguensis TaxID=908355 RepID=A0ABP8EUB3_9MICO